MKFILSHCINLIIFRYHQLIKDKLVTYLSVETSIKRWKKKSKFIPTRPESVEAITQQMRDPEIAARFSINTEQFLHSIPSSSNDSGQSIALFTRSSLERIRERHDACADGTFKIYPGFFRQLFIVQFFVEKFVNVSQYILIFPFTNIQTFQFKAFASFFIYMEKKTYSAYLDVFKYIRDLGLNIKTISLDFELASRKAFKEIFPLSTIYGCVFHLSRVSVN